MTEALVARDHNFKSLDAWRALAAIVVVIYHTGLPAVTSIYPNLGQHWFFDHLRLGAYGVQIFFVISGFCIAQAAVNIIERRHSSSSFMIARLRRIYPPYLFATLCIIILSYTAHIAVSRGLVPTSSLDQLRLWNRPAEEYACSVFLLQKVCGITPFIPLFWTLCYEVAFYVIAFIGIILSTESRPASFFLSLSAGLTLILCVTSAILPDRLCYPFDLWPEFCIGVIAFDFCYRRRTKLMFSLILLTSVLMLVYSLRSNALGSNHYMAVPGEQSFTSVVLVYVLIVNFYFDSKLSSITPIRILMKIGLFSYSLYLSHMLVLPIVAQAAKRLHVSEQTYGWLMMTQVAIAIPFAYVFFLFAEKPFLRKRSNVAQVSPSASQQLREV